MIVFKEPSNINTLRSAIAKVKAQKPFEIMAAVILSDHLHFIWRLPSIDP
jgi:putative transposase